MAEINTVFKATVLQLKHIIFSIFYKKDTSSGARLVESKSQLHTYQQLARFFSLFMSQLLETDDAITCGVGLTRMK